MTASLIDILRYSGLSSEHVAEHVLSMSKLLGFIPYIAKVCK